MIDDRDVRAIRMFGLLVGLLSCVLGIGLALGICCGRRDADNEAKMVRHEIRILVKPSCLNPEHP